MMRDPLEISILCVDDHPLFLEGIATAIGSQDDMRLAAVASTGREAIEQFRKVRPDITLMDLRLPDMNGIAAMVAIRSEFPHARVIILTNLVGDADIQRALAAGARAYLIKSTPLAEFVEVIRKVEQGRTHLPTLVAQNLVEHIESDALSDREVEILAQVAHGKRNREIGACLGISEGTVKSHLRHILEKLGAKDRAEALSIGIRRGIIHL
jgi:DNA-binding NarL/FixJ family response regulator